MVETLRNSSKMGSRNFSITRKINFRYGQRINTLKNIYQSLYDLEFANDFYFLSEIKYFTTTNTLSNQAMNHRTFDRFSKFKANPTLISVVQYRNKLRRNKRYERRK